MTTAADRVLMTARHAEITQKLDAQAKQLAELLAAVKPVVVPPVVQPPAQPPVVQSPAPTPSPQTITQLTADQTSARQDNALQFFGDWLCLGGEGNTPRWPTLSKDCPLPGRTYSFKCASRASSFLALYRSDTPWMYPEGVTFTAMVRYTAGLVANVADLTHKRGQAKLKLMRKNPGGGETGTTGWGIGVDIGNAWGSVAVVEDDGGDYDQSFGYGKIVPDTWQELREYIKPLTATTYEVSAWFGGVQLHNKRVMTRSVPLAVTDKSVIEFGLPVVQMQARPAEENVLYLDDVVMTRGFVPPPAPLTTIARATVADGTLKGAIPYGGGRIVTHPAFDGGFAWEVERIPGVQTDIGWHIQPRRENGELWRTFETEFQYLFEMISGEPNTGSAMKWGRHDAAWPDATVPEGYRTGWAGSLVSIDHKFIDGDRGPGFGDNYYQTSGPGPLVCLTTAANPIKKAPRIRYLTDHYSRGRRYAEASIDGVFLFKHEDVYALDAVLKQNLPGWYIAVSLIRGVSNGPSDHRREWWSNAIVRAR